MARIYVLGVCFRSTEQTSKVCIYRCQRAGFDGKCAVSGERIARVGAKHTANALSGVGVLMERSAMHRSRLRVELD